jgi:uncharacterized lipoprotein YmbA
MTRPALALLAAAALAMAGCGSSPEMRHYVLAAEAAPSPEPDAARVSIAPVTIPDLVDRPDLVVRVGPNRVQIADQDRWGEPLRDAVPRVLAANLQRRLGARYAVTDGREGAPALRVAVDIRQFEAVAGGEVTVHADWTVRRDKAPARPRQSRVREPVAEAGYGGIAGAFSRALDQLAAEIAQEIVSR